MKTFEELKAEAITTAPKPGPVGLQEGDACECSPKMQDAILELAM